MTETKRISRGFSLMELLLAVAIASLLMTVAVPAYDRYVQRANVARATGDIGRISLAIGRFRLNNGDQLPATLADLPMDVPEDPWGRPYAYLNIEAGGAAVTAQVRKDRALNPLNSDFDLYTLGRDGATRPPLSAPDSEDDILRANDGAFIGLGGDY